ncbi:AmmeMemoRadiSam system protein B [Corynebacterium sp. H78]|uniref:AmmeMemoRadiSam system protein B n=1 Tax=Corynebacterium sp. H78 TaxID=3133417 RepID=UPI0030ABE594
MNSASALSSTPSGNQQPPTVRPAAVAGMFYPADRHELSELVDSLLADLRLADPRLAAPQLVASAPSTADSESNSEPIPSRVVVCPHAGLVYSGRLAARSIRSLQEWDRTRHSITTIAIFGPNHRVPWRGACLSGHDKWATPLCEVAVDKQLQQWALTQPNVKVAPAVHAQEHSAEVELPFLQRAFPQARVLPMVIGQMEAHEVAALMEQVLADPGAAVLVSSDLSHFLRDDDARQVDEITLKKVGALESIGPREACGAFSWNGLSEVAAKLGFEPVVLESATSADAVIDGVRMGDRPGGADSVVGYASVAYVEVGEKLPGMARQAIESELGVRTGEPLIPDHPWLRTNGASFVTINTVSGVVRGAPPRLRGCIGTLEAYQPLGVDVVRHAQAAAFEDPRFRPVTADELDSLRIEVSVLSAPQSLGRISRDEALATIRPGIDGVTIFSRRGRATFLPQVWEQLPDADEFLMHLQAKAGWARGSWPDDTEVSIYTVRSWEE